MKKKQACNVVATSPFSSMTLRCASRGFVCTPDACKQVVSRTAVSRRPGSFFIKQLRFGSVPSKDMECAFYVPPAQMLPKIG